MKKNWTSVLVALLLLLCLSSTIFAKSINNNNPPVAICQSTIIQLDSSGKASIVVADINSGSFSTVGIDTIYLSKTTFDCTNLGNNLIMMTVRDINGLTANCNAIVIVEDNVAPVIICPSDTTFTASFDTCGLIFNGFNTAPMPYLQEVRQPTDLVLATGHFGSLMSVAYNPIKNIYYSVNGGNSDVPLITYDANGTILSSVAAGFDARGLWWNPNTNQLQANGWSTTGYRTIDLDVNGLALSTGINNPTGLNQPDINAAGTYDYDANEVLFHVEDSIYRHNLTTGALIGGYSINNLPVPITQYNSGSGSNTGSINVYALGYTGIAGKEIVLYDYNNKRVYSIDKATGDYSGTVQLPASTEFNWLWGFSYTNGKAFVGGSSNFTAFNLASALTCPVTFTQTAGPTTGEIFPVGVHTMKFVATDESGNITLCEYNITITDPYNSIAQCKDITVSLNEVGIVVLDSLMFGNLSTDACGIARMVITPDTLTCANIGANTVSLVVTDVNGNTSSCTAMVTVQDTIAPQMVCPADTIVNADAGMCSAVFNYIIDTVLPVSAMPFRIDTTVTFARRSLTTGTAVTLGDDAVSAALPIGFNFGFFDNSYTSFYISSNGFITFFNSNDNDGCCNGHVLPNSETPQNLIAVGWSDWDPGEGGTIRYETQGTAPNRVLIVDFDSIPYCCSASNPKVTTQIQLYEGTNIVEIHTTDIPLSSKNRTMGVENSNGTEGQAVTGRNGVNTWSVMNEGVRFTPTFNNDNCDGATITQIAGLPSGAAFPIGTTTNTFKITDAAGNSSTCSFKVLVQDTIKPMAICKNITLSLTSNSTVTITPDSLDNGSTDNCGIASKSLSQTTFDCSHQGQNTVLLTVTDHHGNTDTCSAIVTIQEMTPPTAICQSLIVQLDSMGTATISPADINSGSFDNCNVPSLSLSQTTFDCSHLGNNIVSLTATDVDGNRATCTAIVVVEDTIAPVLVRPSDVNLTSTSTCGQVYHFALPTLTPVIPPTGVANCNTNIVQTAGLPSGATFPIGTTILSFKATDALGNTDTCSFSVTVADNQVPKAICENITIELNAMGIAAIDSTQFGHLSTDNCEIASITIAQTSFDCSHLGANRVGIMVTDIYGNSDTCSAIVSVVDNLMPQISCPNDTIVNTPIGLCSAIVNYETPTSTPFNTDNCNGAIIMQIAGLASGAAFPIGITTNRFKITDASGNSSTCSFNILVQDTIKPIAICKNISVALDANGIATIVAADLDNNSTDNCSIASRTLSKSTFDCTDFGANTIQLIVMDNSGNKDSCMATVTIIDTLKSMVQCQDITINLPTSGTATININDVHILSSDPCGIADLSLSKTTFDCSNVGDNIVDLTVTDNNGVTTICQATVRILGTNMPNGGSDFTNVCGPSINLDAAIPLTGIGIWKVLNGDGNHLLADPFNPKSCNYSGTNN